MTKAIQFSFIIPVFNRVDCTRSILTELTNSMHEDSVEFIVIDDASTDDTQEYLMSIKDARVKVITHPKNLGFATTCNDGASSARGENLLLLNNDLILSPGWLEPMLKVQQKHPDAGAIGNIQYRISNGRIDHAGIVFDLVGLPDHYAKNYPFFPGFTCREFPAVTGACILIRKSVFDEMGGFDAAYRNGCEDVDLCLRLRQKGYRNYVAGKSRISHHVSASPGRHDQDSSNNSLLLKRWGDELVSLGQKDWPFQYLMRYWNRPWRYNGTKLIDACLRLAHLRRGDSQWAIQKRNRLLSNN